MAKKKSDKSPEKVEAPEVERANEIAEKVHSHEHVKQQESDLAKHPKFAKFNSNGRI